VAGLESSLKSAKENLQATAVNTPEKMIDVIQDLSVKTKEISNNLKEAQQQDNTIAVAGVKQMVNDTLLSAVETVVQKQSEGATELTDSQVKKMVKEQVEKVVNNAVEVASTTVSSMQYSVSSTTAIVSSTNVIPTTTLEVKNVITSSTEAIKKDAATTQNLIDNNQLLEAIQKAKQVNENTAQIEQKASEAKQTIESGSVTTSTIDKD
jgi:hypothetical protein